MKQKIYYIDDNEQEATLNKKLLESTRNLSVKVYAPPKEWGELTLSIQKESPSVFLIDYELDRLQAGAFHVNYRGSHLATEIRERAPGFPIVIITRESIVDSRKKQELQSELKLIDHVIYKDEVSEGTKEIIHDLVTLGDGFQKLREVPEGTRTWQTLLQLLDSSNEESTMLQKASPPLFADENIGQSLWSISGIADWIRNILIAYPGIVLDSVYAATELRIAEDSFLDPRVQRIFAKARYGGLFAPQGGRWWKGRLWRIAMEYVQSNDLTKFAEVFNKRNKKKLVPAISIITSELPADAVDYIFHAPVLYKFTVAYKPDNRPAIMDQARVSFKAIQESKTQNAFLIGVTEIMLRHIQDMDL